MKDKFLSKRTQKCRREGDRLRRARRSLRLPHLARRVRRGPGAVVERERKRFAGRLARAASSRSGARKKRTSTFNNNIYLFPSSASRLHPSNLIIVVKCISRARVTDVVRSGGSWGFETVKGREQGETEETRVEDDSVKRLRDESTRGKSVLI